MNNTMHRMEILHIYVYFIFMAKGDKNLKIVYLLDIEITVEYSSLYLFSCNKVVLFCKLCTRKTFHYIYNINITFGKFIYFKTRMLCIQVFSLVFFVFLFEYVRKNVVFLLKLSATESFTLSY